MDNKFLIWLSSFDFLTAKKAHTLLEYYTSAENVFKAFQVGDKVLHEILNYEQISKISQNATLQYVDCYIKNLKEQNIKTLTYNDERYPQLLKEIYDYPIVLYAKGNLDLLKTKCLAVVGTRNPSSYGRTVTYDMVKRLAKSGLTIVSGMATGIDSLAHKACLEVNANTIAVLGTGFNHIYPKMNENLSVEIANKGLLLTEYAPSVRAQKFSFISRNRIIAGLSEGVFIPEASKNSGAMHTKEFAIECNRNIYALPGNINSYVSEGTNMLIATSQAQCILGYKDILKDLGITDNFKKEIHQLSIEEQNILNCLKNEPLNFDNLQNQTEIEPKKLNSYLTTMAIRGIIKKLPGNFYSK